MTITADTPLDMFAERTWEARRVTRTQDPDTSLEAARRVKKMGSQLAVLRVLDSTRDPIADHEIVRSIEERPGFAKGVNYSPSRIRTARNELAEAGYAELVENKRVDTDRTPNGARTWRITLAGRLHLMDNA